MTFITIILLAYLIGAVPWGYIIAKSRGMNIQKKGSGNTGATNIYRNLGLSAALLVAVLDILKGSIAVLIAVFSLNSHLEIAVVALAVILGHIYSIFLKGKGGKGIATTFGVLLILMGGIPILFVLLAWVTLLALTRLMSLTNLVLICVFPLYFLFIKPDLAFFLLGTVVTFLIYWVHSENIDRLKLGQELHLDIKVGFTKTKKKRTLPKTT